jgi:hypothetical protein
LLHILKQLARYFPHWQDEIHETGGDGAFDHGVELSGIRMLDDHQPAGAADFSDAESSVRTTARKQHRDRFGASVMSERAKEEIDGQSQAVAFNRLGQMQLAVFDENIFVGGNRINAVGLDRRSIRGCDNLHRRLPRQYVGHIAVVGGIEMLHHDKSKSRFRTDLVKKFLERIHGAR